jgi:hypothetical protein
MPDPLLNFLSSVWILTTYFHFTARLLSPSAVPCAILPIQCPPPVSVSCSLCYSSTSLPASCLRQLFLVLFFQFSARLLSPSAVPCAILPLHCPPPVSVSCSLCYSSTSLPASCLCQLFLVLFFHFNARLLSLSAVPCAILPLSVRLLSLSAVPCAILPLSWLTKYII